MARFRPSPVRSRISSRSNSAMAASSVDNSRPCELPVSQSGSPSERKLAPALPIRSIRSSSSRKVIAFWTEVLENEKNNYTTAERLEASDRIMAYGFGKPPQAIEAHFREQDPRYWKSAGFRLTRTTDHG
jgi:hypothetical protein